MKKYLFTALVFCATGLMFCTSSKKAALKKTTTYTANIQPLMETKCAPCHFPEKGGKKMPLTSYAAVADNIDDIIRRIEMHPDQKGFMPRKRERLSDSTIQMVKEWKAGGLVK